MQFIINCKLFLDKNLFLVLFLVSIFSISLLSLLFLKQNYLIYIFNNVFEIFKSQIKIIAEKLDTNIRRVGINAIAFYYLQYVYNILQSFNWLLIVLSSVEN